MNTERMPKVLIGWVDGLLVITRLQDGKQLLAAYAGDQDRVAAVSAYFGRAGMLTEQRLWQGLTRV